MVDNSNKVCFCFPGQGAQYPGMGKDLYDQSAKVKKLFELAADQLGLNVTKLLFEGDAEDLQNSRNAQIAITLVNLACLTVLEERGIVSKGSAGFSLGEYAAFVDAGVISIEDIFPVVVGRGEIMQSQCEMNNDDIGSTGMAAVIGLDPDSVNKVLTSSGVKDIYGANYNSPVQLVLSGTTKAIEEITPLLKDAGARRVLPLKVAGAFHSPLMKHASEQLADFLKGITFNDPIKPLYSNVTGKIVSSGVEIKKLCSEHLISPVQWISTCRQIKEDGFDTAIESGPGAVLCGLWKKQKIEGIESFPTGTFEKIEIIS